MEDPSLKPSSDDANPSPQIQQNLEGDDNQAIGEMKGGTAIGKIVGNVIYNYYYREEVKTAINDPADAAESDPLPCPYRGLFHFGPGDAEYFFGRETFVRELLGATQTRNFISLLGASGSGKSSVVLAGLVPKLQQAGHWQFTHFRPGADPFHALALALVPLYTTNLDETERIRQSRNLAGYLRTGEVLLADVFAQIQQNFPTDRVLLIADQFEELYTLCTDETTRRNFLDILLAGIAAPSDRSPFDPILIATMRADFLGQALSYRPFADVLQNTDLKLGPMNREELAEVIEKPAQKLGVTFEAGLVERILDDVDAEPGILPLLEFALTELWQRRSGKELTHAAYESIGEVQGALGRHANQEYAKLSEADRERVRRIFIQLVRPGEGAADTRRMAMKTELGEESWSLVKDLADARLVVTSRNSASGQETVEVVHEALIRNWGELRGWMDNDRVFRAWQERLRGAMRQWQETKHDEGSLLRGAALAEAEEQLRKRPEELISESGFIERSLQERERIQQAETDRRKGEIKTARKITAGSLLAVVVSSGLGLMAWKQTQQAEINLADVLSASALSLVENGKDLDAFIPAIRAGKIQQNQKVSNPSGLNALQEALNHRRESNRLEGHQKSVKSVSFSPDGQTLATGSDDKTIKLWNVATGKEILTLQGHQKSVKSVSFSPDGQTLATGSDDNTIKLWNVATGKEIRTLQGHQESFYSVSFSPDGQTLASSSDDNTIKLWNVATGKEILTLQGHQNFVRSVSFSPDGQTLATGSDDNTIKLWNVATGKEILTLQGHQKSVYSVSFSPDGRTLATGSGDNTIKLWNPEAGKEISTLQGHQASVNSVSFSPDDKTLATSAWDSKIKLWNVAMGKEIRTLQGHQNFVRSVSFSPDGRTLASSSDDKTIKLWNPEAGREIRTLQGHQASVNSVSFSPDGKTLATGSGDNTIKLWNVATGKEIRTLQGYTEPVNIVSFSPDGKTLATGSDDSTIKLWNVATGKEILTLQGHQKSVYSVSFSPDGQTLATGSDDSTIKLWNVATGKEILTLQGHQKSVYSVSFSPDGQTLATGSGDSKIKLWNVDTGKEIRTLQGHQESVYSVSFSPDGQTLATGGWDKKIKLWRLDLDPLMRRSCDWARGYLENNINVSESDKHLCDGIGTKKQ
jgi:WD40 repeat protein